MTAAECAAAETPNVSRSLAQRFLEERMQVSGSTPLGDALLTMRGDVSGDYWPFIGGASRLAPTSQQSNEFLLGSILQMRMKAAPAWANASTFVDAIGRPDNIWSAIRSLPNWESDPRFLRLHRYPQARLRVHRTAERMRDWNDDANRLWPDPAAPDLTLGSLLRLGAGPQISRMIVGALFDVGLLDGAGTIKADVHTRRVLGRLVRGVSELDAAAAERLARDLVNGPSWALDATLFRLGRTVCRPASPRCSKCDPALRGLCNYASTTGSGPG